MIRSDLSDLKDGVNDMIDTMEYLALGIGFIYGIGYLSYSEAVKWLPIVFFYSFYRTKDGFYGLYDTTDDEDAYKAVKSLGVLKVASYAEYLRIHQVARSSAYKRFKHYYSALMKYLIVRIVPILVLPAILFWGTWYLFVIGVSLALIVMIINATVIAPGNLYVGRRLMVFAVMKQYSDK